MALAEKTLEFEARLALASEAWKEVNRIAPLVLTDSAVIGALVASRQSLREAERVAASRAGVSVDALRPKGRACLLAVALLIPQDTKAAIIDPRVALSDDFLRAPDGPVRAALHDFLRDPTVTGRKRLAPKQLVELLQPIATSWAALSRQLATLIEQIVWDLLETHAAGVRRAAAIQAEAAAAAEAALEAKRRRRRMATARKRAAKEVRDSTAVGSSVEDEGVVERKAESVDAETSLAPGSPIKNSRPLPAFTVHEWKHCSVLEHFRAANVVDQLLLSQDMQEQRRENLQWRCWALGRALSVDLDRSAEKADAVGERLNQTRLLAWMQPGREYDTLWMRETRWEAKCLRAAKKQSELDGRLPLPETGDATPPILRERMCADMLWRRWQQSRRPLETIRPWATRTPSPRYRDTPGDPRIGAAAALAAVPAYAGQVWSEAWEPQVLVPVPLSRLSNVWAALG